MTLFEEWTWIRLKELCNSKMFYFVVLLSREAWSSTLVRSFEVLANNQKSLYQILNIHLHMLSITRLWPPSNLLSSSNLVFSSMSSEPRSSMVRKRHEPISFILVYSRYQHSAVSTSGPESSSTSSSPSFLLPLCPLSTKYGNRKSLWKYCPEGGRWKLKSSKDVAFRAKYASHAIYCSYLELKIYDHSDSAFDRGSVV